MSASTLILLNLLLITASSTSSAMDQLTDVVFQYTTTEEFNDITMTIGWMQYASCTEGLGPVHSLNFANGYNVSKYAITVKILPSTDTPGNEDAGYAVKANICSNPIYALNNGYELSYTLNESTTLITGLSNMNNWIGSANAKHRLENECIYSFDDGMSLGGNPRLISNNHFYLACNNPDGLHIFVDFRGIYCMFDYSLSNPIGVDISIWVGFDVEKIHFCELDSSGTYRLSTQESSTIEPVDSTLSPTAVRLDSTVYSTLNPLSSTKNTTSFTTTSVTEGIVEEELTVASDDTNPILSGSNKGSRLSLQMKAVIIAVAVLFIIFLSICGTAIYMKRRKQSVESTAMMVSKDQNTTTSVQTVDHTPQRTVGEPSVSIAEDNITVEGDTNGLQDDGHTTHGNIAPDEFIVEEDTTKGNEPDTDGTQWSFEAKCVDCGQSAIGEIYDDGLFYCMTCWKFYEQ